MVKVLGVLELGLVRGGAEILVGADLGVGAARAALEPGLALGLVDGGGLGDGIDGDVLVVVEGAGNLGAVGELDGDRVTQGRVEALGEALGRDVQGPVLGGGDLQLRGVDLVGVEGGDGQVRLALDVAVAVELGRRVHLVGAQRGEVHFGEDLGGAVAVAVEDVDAQDLLGGGEGGHGCDGSGGGGELGVHLFLVVVVVVVRVVVRGCL